MKFTKFGKALLMTTLSAAVVLSVSSCVQSYTVGYLYVTGTITAQPGGNGIISGFDIDHNTGKLNNVDGLPISSGGANPVRAVLVTGSRFIYVLNRGVNSTGGDSGLEYEYNKILNGTPGELTESVDQNDNPIADPPTVPITKPMIVAENVNEASS